MNIILWMMIGAVIGVTTCMISPTAQRGGILSATFLGLIGGVLGGFTANILLNSSLFKFDIQSFGLSITGALFLLLIGKLLSFDIEVTKRIKN